MFLLEDYNFCFLDVSIPHHSIATESGECAQCFS